MADIRCSLLIGRTWESGELTALVEAAQGGAGGSRFVVGEAGIGKSRLLGMVADLARSRGMVVLQGRAAPSPVPVPYRPFAEAFVSASRGVDLTGDGSLEQFRSALAMLVPGRFEPAVDATPSVVLLGEATIALIERCAAGRGALVVLEDLQWTDAETCELVDYLSDKLGGLPVAMVGSVRTGDGSAAERMVRGIDAGRRCPVLSLGRLDSAEMDAFIGTALGMDPVPPIVRDAVTSATGGVPLLIEDTLGVLIDRGALQRRGSVWTASASLAALVPLSFSAMVRDRMEGLGGDARRMLEVAAVLGERFDWEWLSPIVGVDPAEVVACLRRGVEAQLIDEVPGPDAERFRFRHGLSRAAVLELIVGRDRSDIAARSLSVLHPDHPPAEAIGAELLADLAVTAGDERACSLLIEAAGNAIASGACTSGQRLAEHALRLARSDEQRLGAREVLLAACASAGDPTRTAQVGADLMADLEQLGITDDRRGSLRLQLASAAIEATDWRSATAYVDAAVAGTDEANVGPPGRVDMLRAAIALGHHDPVTAAVSAQRALEIGTERDDLTLVVEALALLGRARRVTDVAGAADAFRRAVLAAQRSGSALLQARAEAELGTIDVLLAGPPDTLERARRLALDAGAVGIAASVDFHLSIVHWLRFDVERFREAVARAYTAAIRYDLGLKAPATLVMQGAMEAVMGRRAEAMAVFERAVADMDVEIEATNRGHTLALAALACEDRPAAMAELQRAAELAPAYSDVARAPFRGMHALVLAVTSDAQARPVADALLADPAVIGVTRHLAFLASAVLSGREGHGDTALPVAKKGFEELVSCPWFQAMGQRLVGEAAQLDRWGTPEQWLRDAAVFFEQAGIVAPALACAALLDAAEVTPVPSGNGRLGSLEGVSRREAEVLELVARGMTNREIADRLYLSVRTVEKHVERLLAKTGSVNRATLVALSHSLEHRPAG
ncbi:MAG: ATP-binding protein [Acidimicrobiales bacterium]